MKTIDVLCVGGAVVDIPLQPVNRNIFDIESYPIDDISMTMGGDALNQSIVISRLGHKVSLMSRLGDDIAGNYIKSRCAAEGVATQDLRMDADTTTSINVGLVTEDGERTFVTNRNGSLWKTDITDINLDHFGEARLLSLGSIFNCPLLDGRALTKIFATAKEEGLIVCADFIKPRLKETLADIAEALGYVDYIFPNYDEACLLTGETELESIADTFLALGVGTVVIKNGKKGCFIKRGETVIEVPAVQGIQAIDSIGAGDNFVSGFITAILEDKDLTECGRFANATASIAVQSVGATTGVTERKKVDDRYAVYGLTK